jgi:hypothetical protein
MYEWYINEWIHLVALQPSTGNFFVFQKGEFLPLPVDDRSVPKTKNLSDILETSRENLPVYLVKS